MLKRALFLVLALTVVEPAYASVLCDALVEAQKDRPDSLPFKITIGGESASCVTDQDDSSWACAVYSYHACHPNPHKDLEPASTPADDIKKAYDAVLVAVTGCLSGVPAQPLRYDQTSLELARISQGVLFSSGVKNVYVMKKGVVAQDNKKICQSYLVDLEVVGPAQFDPYLPIPVDPLLPDQEGAALKTP